MVKRFLFSLSLLTRLRRGEVRGASVDSCTKRRLTWNRILSAWPFDYRMARENCTFSMQHTDATEIKLFSSKFYACFKCCL